MGMDRLRARLATGRPLRVPELAQEVGCSREYIRRLIHEKALRTGKVGRVFTIPVREAEKLARAVGALSD